MDARLQYLDFQKTATGQFSRGHVFGDFSTKLIKLKVVVDSQLNEITLAAASFVVLFDTGDLWHQMQDILS